MSAPVASPLLRRPLYVTRVYRFNAGHRLYNPRRDAAWNRRVFGKCANPDGHGHNYTLEVTLRGTIDPATGWVLDPRRLDRLVERRVLGPIDHHDLNRVLRLRGGAAPTTEVLALEIWARLAPFVPPPAALHQLRIAETAKNSFEYFGPAPRGPALSRRSRARPR